MPNIITHKRSSTSGVVPVASGLSQGELAINIADGRLYTKNNTNTVINLGVSSISGTSISPASGNFTSLTVNGTGVISSSGGTTNYISKFTSSSTIGNSLIFDNGTNVGIGTTTPQELLHVSGTISSSAGNLLRLNNSSATSNPSINFRIGGVGNYDSHFFISRNGTDVFGIDTNNRGVFLNSFSLFGNQSFLSYNNANALIKLQNTTTNDLEISAVSGILFQSQQSTKMRMDQSGNFGIGTTTPTSQLHVVGSGRFVGSNNNVMIINSTNENGSASIDAPTSLYNDISLRVNSQNIFRGLDNWTGTWADSVSTTYFQVGRSAGNTIFTSLVGNPFNRLAYAANKYLFTNQTSNITVPTNYFNVEYNGTGIISASTAGNVGIGTTTPSTLLEISKDGGGVDLSLVRIANTNAAGGTALKISRTGPQRAAQVIYQSGTTDQFYQGILRDGGVTTNGWSVSTGADLNVTAPAIHVTSGNYVGIGTKSPTAQLHVVGSGLFTSGLNVSNQTASAIAGFDVNKNITSLSTVTYPSLTELSYLKGASSAVQTQLNNRMLLTNGSSVDINSITNGITRVYPTGNGPDGGGTHVTAFTSMQDTSNNYGWQIAGYSNAFYFRHKGATFDPWYRMWTNYDFTSSNITNWNTAYGWGNHASAGYAPINSPTLTGTPTAPTASSGTNTTQIATTAFVRTEISSLVDAAPGTLDTLNELAAALGDDPNFATTVTNSISTKVAGTGTINYVPKFTASQTLQNSLIFDNGTNVGIGTASPQSKVHITDTNDLNTTIEYTNATAGFASGVRPLKLLLTGSNGIGVGAGVGIDFVTKSSSTEYTGARIVSNRTDTSNNHALTFWAGGGTTSLSEYMRISSNGNIGIGTTSPSAKLHSEISDGNSVLLLQRASSQGGLSVDFTGGVSNLRSLNGFKIFTGSVAANVGTERLNITSGGDIGIGISSPSHKLHVSGVIRSTSYITSDTEFRLNNLTFARVATMDGGGGFAGGYNVYLSGSTPKHSVNAPISSYYYYSDGTIRFYTNSSQSADTDASERLRITSAGNVGIGLTNPVEKLEIDGSLKFANCTTRVLRGDGNCLKFSATSSALGHYGIYIDNTATAGGRNFRLASWADGTTGKFIIRDDTSGADRLAIDANGNVGIGTATPSGKLHVVGNSYFTDKIYGGSGNAFIQFNVAGQNRIDIGSDSASSSAFIGTTALYLNSPQLYANTTLSFPKTATAVSTATQKDSHSIILYNSMWNGSAELQTDSTIRSIASTSVNTRSRLAFLTSNEDGTNNKVERLSILTNGNLGIGTTTPTYKLEVNGSFAASTKSFRIDHPSKKDHSLEYGSLESPYHGVRLTGRGTVVKGVGVVSVPDYLKDLIHDDDTLNIQITNIKHGKTIYIDKIDLQNDRFIVKVDRAKSLGELQFCWTLTGVRKDVDHLVVEKEN